MVSLKTEMVDGGSSFAGKASMLDVARFTGLSVSTISQAINGMGRISKETRDRVLSACQTLHYRPHPTAQFLPKLRHRSKGRVLTGLYAFTPSLAENDDPSVYSLFMNGAVKVCYAQRKMLVYQSHIEGHEADHMLSSTFGMDGRLFVGRIGDEVVHLFESEHAPLVVLGDHRCERPVWNVNTDVAAAARMAVEMLWGLGHRRIQLVTAEREVWYELKFLREFCGALEERGGDGSRGSLLANCSIEQLRDRLTAADHPTALVCVGEFQAQNAFRAMARAGLEAPRDLSVLMFGRPGVYVPRVSHVDPSYENVGRAGMELMVRLAANPALETPTRTLVPPVFVDQGTCANFVPPRAGPEIYV